MKEVLNFLIEVGKLKKMSRTGRVWLRIKNPETIAQHVFRAAIMNWILAEEVRPKLNLEKIIKISLVHDLCAIYAGDITRGKFKKGKRALERLIKNLEPKLKKEIMNCWLDYERFRSREGRFVKQGDKIETLLQAKEYWKIDSTSPVFGWWEEVQELVDEPVLLKFLKEIEKEKRRKTPLGNILDFLIKINELKQIPRTGLVFRGIKNPETIAEHAFRTAIMTWVLGERKKINMGKALKMALVHEICEVYTGDATPYDHLLPRPREEIKEMFLNPAKFPQKEREEIIEYLREMYKIWPKFPKKEKEKIFRQDYQNEKRALQKLTQNLPQALKKEIIHLWDDFKRQITKEGRFVSQVYWIQIYFQALEYLKEDPDFPIRSWREQMIQIVDDQVLLEFFKELEEKFYQKRKVVF